MARARNHKAEYQRRIERGLAKGLTRSAARGHSTRAKRNKAKPEKPDRKVQDAVRAMNEGSSLTKAARAAHVSPERLRTFIKTNKLARRSKRGWVMRDARNRRVQIISGGTSKTIRVSGFATASEVGRHAAAVRYALESGDFSGVFAFRRKGVRDISGKFHRFETDPNALFRYATRDEPEFHEIYKIVST
jgi:hypothetical protein